MLLAADRLYSVAETERLPAILANSRKYQNVVSTQLAGQVLDALYELLRGFQAANDQSKGELLRDVLARDPDHVYQGLLTILLRLVFVLYAEDRGLLSTDPVYVNHYSVTGLYERLRADAGRFPDTMYHRYGAWGQLLALFRLIYRGGSHGALHIPAREGYLFDPDRYLFLEGRLRRDDDPSIPRVSDGVLFNVLEKLLLLDGDRLSYRTLAVEQIGSVYEAVMGFELQVATGQSIAVKPVKKHGAPTTIDLDELLRSAPDKRQKWFTDKTDQKLASKALEVLMAAGTTVELIAVLENKIARSVTPNPVPKDAMIFQPSDERRRTGSHYTPSSLTGPIVRTALEPVLKRLGPKPTPDQILALKICDPAMGSGAFLVEACREVGDALVRAWHEHGEIPVLPPDEDETLYAQRQVAQRCLYGIDKNLMATDLAKLSLWLATLAREHPFTFLDHNLRTGDSLVGLTRQQIAAFHWAPEGGSAIIGDTVKKRIERAAEYRRRILSARDSIAYAQLAQELSNADNSLFLPRQIGDAVIAAFFNAPKNASREQARKNARVQVDAVLRVTATAELPKPPKTVQPFHWELEFPEVFDDASAGFDAIVGNPPFAGKNTLIAGHAEGYLDWLKILHAESHGNSDLVAHFFRRAFTLLKPHGCFGLIATNTIGQGDTRSTGLRWICTHAGTIYQARKRLKWPGQAAVVVSIVHIAKGAVSGPYQLDGQPVDRITAYLFHAGGNEDPQVLVANENKSFQGSVILGMGFTFDDSDKKGVASPLVEMHRLIEKDPRNKVIIFPLIGWAEITDNPKVEYDRYVINFEDFPLKRKSSGESWLKLKVEAQRAELSEGIVAPDYPYSVAEDWPDLLAIVKQRVKPERDLLGVNPDAARRRKFWWLWGRYTPSLFAAANKLERVIVAGSQASTHFAFSFLPKGIVYSSNLSVIAVDTYAAFCTLQSRVHEVWARFFMSTLEDRLAYTPTTCFEPFPFPHQWTTHVSLGTRGQEYYEFRSAVMVHDDEGLTKTYNRFHDPSEMSGEIVELRQMHDRMDRAVLDAYGWTDIVPHCEFIPEFADGEEEQESPRPHPKKYRYRWPDETRDEVLARLLDLNRQRALDEGQLLGSPQNDNLPSRKRGVRKKAAAANLFAQNGEDSE